MEGTSFSDEMFLKFIQTYPALYDAQQKGYHNRLMKDRGWENVARHVQSNGKLHRP